MSEELAVRPAQLRPTSRADKVQSIAAYLAKATPALVSHGKVAAAEQALHASTKLESRTTRVENAKAPRAKGGTSDYGGTPDVAGKGQTVDIRVF